MNAAPRPDSRPSSEVQSAITLVDFFELWQAWRKPFLGGLVLVAALTIAWTKLVRTEFFLAETTFSVGSQFTSISRPGLADMQLFEADRSDKFLVRQIIMAEQWLRSRDVLVEAVAALKRPSAAGEPAYDIYAMLDIREETPLMRDASLTKLLVDDLTRVTQIQNSGVVRFGVELPDPTAAARFSNACIDVLQKRFTEDIFSELDGAVTIYERDLAKQLEERRKLGAEQLSLGAFDVNPTVQARRSALQEQLDLQAEALGTLVVNIEHLRIATDPLAREAAQPVTVIEKAWPPLHKNRPKTILSTIVACAVYTFVFMIGLVLVGFLRAAGRQRRASA